MPLYMPDFESECRLCGTTPCVIVVGHVQQATELCGSHFFNDRSMLEWEDWNNEPDSTE